jgi:putative ABC transport system permease protein
MSGVYGLALMVRRSLRQHAVSTSITALSVALGCGLLMSVFVIKTQSYDAFTSGSGGFDAVMGARGSQLQLVLNSIYHLEQSTGNLPWKLYEQIKENPIVEEAYPYAVGDNYVGFRIIGTVREMFADHEYKPGRKFVIQPEGRLFDNDRREAIIGSFAAQKARLKVGDVFNTFHGLTYDPSQRHEDQFLVVGVLAPTNTPADRAIWIPLEGYFRMSGHALGGAGGDTLYKPQAGVVIPDEHKEVSAVMLKLRSPQAGFTLSQTINRQGKLATLAWPIGKIMAELFDRIGWVNKVLALVAYMVVVIAAGSITASIYNSMNERRREFAILRALGARKSTVLTAIVAEAATIALLGTLIGYVIYGVIMFTAAAIVQQQTGVVLEPLGFHPVLVLTPIGMILLGGLAGLIPAFKAYTTDVATNLIPAS